MCINDLVNPHLPGLKLLEELVLDFDVSSKDRRKYNFLIQNIPCPWLQCQKIQGLDFLGWRRTRRRPGMC